MGSFIWRSLKIAVIAVFGLIVTAVLVAVSFNIYQSLKRPDTIKLDVVFTQHGCQESCYDHLVKKVDRDDYQWLVGKVVNIVQYSNTATHGGLPADWLDQNYRVFCVTGKLHRAKDAFFWFWPRGEVYNFTGYAVKPGMCSNPNAKKFKG
jgi:hypothetical protein